MWSKFGAFLRDLLGAEEYLQPNQTISQAAREVTEELCLRKLEVMKRDYLAKLRIRELEIEHKLASAEHAAANA